MNEVLCACSKPIMKTDILYKVRLTAGKLTSIMDKMLHAGLLIQVDDRYYITEKGRDFIRTWRKIQSFL